jgi:hypothetical protein
MKKDVRTAYFYMLKEHGHLFVYDERNLRLIFDYCIKKVKKSKNVLVLG